MKNQSVRENSNNHYNSQLGSRYTIRSDDPTISSSTKPTPQPQKPPSRYVRRRGGQLCSTAIMNNSKRINHSFSLNQELVHISNLELQAIIYNCSLFCIYRFKSPIKPRQSILITAGHETVVMDIGTSQPMNHRTTYITQDDYDITNLMESN